MLAAVGKPASFADLARYLIYGPHGTTPSDRRVAWLFTRNLPTDDPATAAKLMDATAQLSARTKQAAYHVIVAWHPKERPTPEEQRDIASMTLLLAGLDQHQALIVGHGDTEHAHLHMLVNRIHPDTGRAWKTTHDYWRFHRIMQDIAEVYGFTPVPAHSFEPAATDTLPTESTRRAHHAAKRGAATNRPQWSRKASRDLGARLSESLDQASTWDDIDAAIASHGYRLDAKGQGLIVGTDSSYSKFSRLGLSVSAKGLEARFGESFATYQARKRTSPAVAPTQPQEPARSLFTVDGVDILKIIGTDEQYRAAVAEAVANRSAWIAQSSLGRQLDEELKSALKATTNLTTPKTSRAPVTPPRRRSSPSLSRR